MPVDNSERVAVEAEDLASLYRSMLTIRRFEEELVTIVAEGLVPGATHEYTGQEAVAVGVCSALRPHDVLTSTHRGHGHLLARGASVRGMFAELMGRETGLNKGRGGSMHAADLSLGILGANGMVGAGGAFAAGAAWAAQRQGRDTVAVAFFGDGAMNQGVLLEAMNLATIWNLPVVFVCENNGFAVTLRSDESLGGGMEKRALGFGLSFDSVDGMDVQAVRSAADRLIEKARTGGGPSFLETRTYRFVGHNTGEKYLKLNYRSDDEVGAWQSRDPLIRASSQLEVPQRDLIHSEVEDVIIDGLDFAKNSPHPEASSAHDFMYRERQA